MIKEIASDLLSVSEKTWALYAYKKEPLRGKVSFEEYWEKYYPEAKADGERLAELYRDKSLEELVKDLCLKVEMLPMAPGQAIYNFAIFNEPDTIQIYEDNAEETQMVIDSLEDERIKVNIRDMLLAHEVCHALQNKHPELFIHKPLISLWKLFGYENVSKLVSLEEVCAMYFAKSFLHMSCMPYVYDVFMCMSRAPKRAREIYEMIMDLKEECHE